MKKLEELTLKEYDEYKELLLSEDFDIFSILRLLGYKDPENMEMREFNLITNSILNQVMEIPKLKEEYEINGRILRPVLMIQEIKSAQFIDFQSYMANYKLHQVLSVFLLPVVVKKNIFKVNKKTVMKYNDGYDMVELQNFIYNNFTIGDALALSGFFLNLSLKLLPVMENSLIMKTMKEKIKQEKLKKKMK